jgi:hypothetical protein
MVSVPSNSSNISSYGFVSGTSSLSNTITQNNVPPQVLLHFTIVSFDEKDAKKFALKYIDTEYGLTIESRLSSINNNQKKIDTLAEAMLGIRDYVINMAKSVFANETKVVALIGLTMIWM